jgi:DNA-binding transcriptional LysR family regulator
MRLRQLEAFLEVADGLHYGRAARSLYVSTSTVSRLVAQLERDLHVQLLDRTSRAVRLTPDGQELVEPARRALAAVEDFDTAARRLALGAAPGER